jgi:hypothetical protein
MPSVTGREPRRQWPARVLDDLPTLGSSTSAARLPTVPTIVIDRSAPKHRRWSCRMGHGGRAGGRRVTHSRAETARKSCKPHHPFLPQDRCAGHPHPANRSARCNAFMSASFTAKRRGTARSPKRRFNPDTSGIRRPSRYRGARHEARRPDDERAVQASKSSWLWTRDAPNVTVDNMRVVGGADRGWHGITIFKSAGQGKIMG